MEPEPAVPFRIAHQRDGGDMVVEVSGEVDLATAPELRASLVSLIVDQGLRSVVLDLSGVTFIDSSGLTVLVQAHKRLALHDGRLVVRRPSAGALHLLRLTGLDALLDIVDVEQA